MATIIDALVVTLGLDATAFKKGQQDTSSGLKKMRDDTTKTGKEVSHQGKQMAESFASIRNQVLGLLAAFTAGQGLKAFVSSVTSSDAATGRLARNIGIGVGQFSAWQNAAEIAGGSAKGIAGTMYGLTQQFQQLAITGQSAVVPFFRAADVALADSANKARPVGDVLLDLADKFSNMDAARAQFLGHNMGIDEDTVNVLIKGRTAIQEYLAEAEKLGHINAEDAASAAERQRSWRELSITFSDLGRKILTDLTPAIVGLSNMLTKVSEWFHDHQGVAEALFGAITVAVVALTAAITVGLVGTALAGLGVALTAAGAVATVAFAGIGAVIAAILGPIGLVIAGIAAIGAAAAVVYHMWPGKKKSASASEGAPGAAPAVTGGNDTEKFMAMGWSKEQAAGIAANIQSESGGNEKAVGDSGQAYGLGQWHRDRQANFKKWLNKDIRDSTRDEQLAFINYELRQGTEQAAGRKLAGTSSAYDAGSVVSKFYERPRAVEEAARNRGQLAAKIDSSMMGGSNMAVSNQTNHANTNNQSSSSQNINIASVTVTTQATDANGVAQGLVSATKRYAHAGQANTSVVG